MSYFKMFPKIQYDAKGNGVEKVMTDIFSRVKIRTDIKGDIYNFDYYDVRDGETPEMIAHKYYDDPMLHWTILVANDIVDYYSEWPMSVQRFEQYIKDKYPNPAAIHHYEVAQTSGDPTVMIDVGMNTTDYPSATAISFYTHEQLLQDEKRKIRLIQPEFIEDMVKEYELLLREGN